MSVLPPLPPDIGRIAGGILIGFCLHWGLFGALSVQVYLYYLAFSKDPLKRKILVYSVYTAELVQTILFTTAAVRQFADGFGNFEALNNDGLLWFSAPILSSTIACVVQIFYAYRIKILSKSNVIAMLVVVFALIQLGGAIGQGVIGEQVLFFTKFSTLKRTLVLAVIWSGATAVCDIIIAASMTYYLSRRRIDYKPTQKMVHKLIRLIIETGTLTATIAIINLALYLLPGHPTYWQCTTEILGKLYSNVMMVVLNNRIVFKINNETITSNEPLVFYPGGVSPRLPHGGISVTREQWTVPLDAQGLELNHPDDVHTLWKVKTDEQPFELHK